MASLTWLPSQLARPFVSLLLSLEVWYALPPTSTCSLFLLLSLSCETRCHMDSRGCLCHVGAVDKKDPSPQGSPFGTFCQPYMYLQVGKKKLSQCPGFPTEEQETAVICAIKEENSPGRHVHATSVQCPGSLP